MYRLRGSVRMASPSMFRRKEKSRVSTACSPALHEVVSGLLTEIDSTHSRLTLEELASRKYQEQNDYNISLLTARGAAAKHQMGSISDLSRPTEFGVAVLKAKSAAISHKIAKVESLPRDVAVLANELHRLDDKITIMEQLYVEAKGFFSRLLESASTFAKKLQVGLHDECIRERKCSKIFGCAILCPL